MRTLKLVSTALFLLTVASVPAFAQLLGGGTDPVPTRVGESFVKSIGLSAYFNSYLYKFNNGDLRSTDNTSIQTVEISDDNLFIGYLELGAMLKAQLVNDIEFFVDVYRVGYWGNDSPEYTSANPIYFRQLYFALPLFEGLDFKVGRFRYSMNNDRAHNNYVLTDLIDAILIKFHPIQEFGIDFFGDLFSMNAPIDAVYELRAHRHSDVTRYFEGDVNIIRFAFMPYITPVKEEAFLLTLKPYAMFSRVGAIGKKDGTQGGNEITSAGATGNNADNDWLLMAGLTAYTKVEIFSAYIEFGYSLGKDRRGPGIPDVDISGFMIHGSLSLDIGDFASITAGGLYASGASTDENGDYKNYGYVSFKADKVGGFLYRDYYGAYPYGILGTRGIQVDPAEAAKRSPMAAATLKASIDNLDFKTFSKGRDGIDLDLEFWAYFDTSSTGADFSGANYTLAADRYDQKRFGEFMGWELDLRIAWSVSDDLLTVGAEAGMFVPGKFFAFPVANIRSPFGNDTFYGLTVFSSLRF